TFALAQPSDLARAPAIRVLHAAFVVPGAALGLSAATVCDRPADPACIVTGAAVSVRGSDDRAWTRVAGHEVGGAYRFVVPASRIGADGFDYRLSFRTADGGTTPYPPSGVPLHVSSTAGLARTERVASFSWSRVR